MNEPPSKLAAERELLSAALRGGPATRLRTYLKLSGPGWLQSAITLGGGSLASSLYLGILAGYALMWLQPLAMILGIIMLSAIGYVTMSTGERPFRAINEHVNPVLGWGWALAVAAANIVWCLPQYSLANGVLTQNLLPGLLGSDGAVLWLAGSAFAGQDGFSLWMAANANKLVIAVTILLAATIVTWSYDRGGFGLRLYETILKVMVAIIVFSFFGVVLVMTLSREGLPWGEIFRGLVPDLRQFVRPTATFDTMLGAIRNSAARDFWAAEIVDKQRDVVISAAATAVGINMTFLFPYSLLRKGWTREFRGLAIFDLSTGMFIPYVLATGCVVIAAGAQFHTRVTDDFVIDSERNEVIPPERFQRAYEDSIQKRASRAEIGGEVELAEKKLAAALVNRQASDLSGSLNELTGPLVANYIFGIGVLAMTLSTISLLMLISGFVFCELLGLPQGGWGQRVGTLLAGLGGALGPFVWKDASFYLAVPTSVFGFVLLPFAYVTFVLLMNQKSLLQENAPRGLRRIAWNLLMGIAASVAALGSIYMIWVKARYYGVAAVTAFVLLALMVQLNRYNERRYAKE